MSSSGEVLVRSIGTPLLNLCRPLLRGGFFLSQKMGYTPVSRGESKNPYISTYNRDFAFFQKNHSPAGFCTPLFTFLGVSPRVGEWYTIPMTCKKCGTKLTGKQLSYCSVRCSRRHLKSLWQKRRREVVNAAKRALRKKINRASDQEPPHKRKARNEVKNAIRRGVLIKMPCEVCEDKNTQAHHDDYSKPLEVRWLCPQHHTDLHHNRL